MTIVGKLQIAQLLLLAIVVTAYIKHWPWCFIISAALYAYLLLGLLAIAHEVDKMRD